jgi:hypothetical protein
LIASASLLSASLVSLLYKSNVDHDTTMSFTQESEVVEKSGVYDVRNGSIEPGASDDSLSDRHHGTYHDVRDMGRLGKKQEFMRNFRFYSILGFTSTLMATWEAMLA